MLQVVVLCDGLVVEGKVEESVVIVEEAESCSVDVLDEAVILHDQIECEAM